MKKIALLILVLIGSVAFSKADAQISIDKGYSFICKEFSYPTTLAELVSVETYLNGERLKTVGIVEELWVKPQTIVDINLKFKRPFITTPVEGVLYAIVTVNGVITEQKKLDYTMDGYFGTSLQFGPIQSETYYTIQIMRFNSGGQTE